MAKSRHLNTYIPPLVIFFLPNKFYTHHGALLGIALHLFVHLSVTGQIFTGQYLIDFSKGIPYYPVINIQFTMAPSVDEGWILIWISKGY